MIFITLPCRVTVISDHSVPEYWIAETSALIRQRGVPDFTTTTVAVFLSPGFLFRSCLVLLYYVISRAFRLFRFIGLSFVMCSVMLFALRIIDCRHRHLWHVWVCRCAAAANRRAAIATRQAARTAHVTNWWRGAPAITSSSLSWLRSPRVGSPSACQTTRKWCVNSLIFSEIICDFLRLMMRPGLCSAIKFQEIMTLNT